MRWILALSAIIALLAGPRAHAMTVAELNRYCEKPPGTDFENGLCFGFIEGVVNTLDWMNAETRPPLYCLPRNMSRGDLMETIIAFVRYDKSDPKTPAVMVVETGLRARYPCRGGATK